MAPTLFSGQMKLMNRFAFNYRDPDSGEIVVILDPEDKGYAIKRIIAKPGDTLRIKDGQLYLNNKKLDERYLPQGISTNTLGQFPDQFYIFGHDRYFLLGDNRTNSIDSRMYGAVPSENILGTVAE